MLKKYGISINLFLVTVLATQGFSQELANKPWLPHSKSVFLTTPENLQYEGIKEYKQTLSQKALEKSLKERALNQKNVSIKKISFSNDQKKNRSVQLHSENLYNKQKINSMTSAAPVNQFRAQKYSSFELESDLIDLAITLQSGIRVKAHLRNRTSPEISTFPSTLNVLRTGGIAFSIDSIFQLNDTGNISWEHSSQVGGLRAFAKYTGRYSANRINHLLSKTEVGKNISSTLPRAISSRSVSKLGGGLAGTMILAYGSYFLGHTDLRVANRWAAVSAVSLASEVGLWTLVATYGTASTGTAIGSLSGAAATSATWAWFGGGSLAAGGFGMSGGAIVLSGGTVAIVMAASAGLSWCWDYLDEKEKEQLIKGRIKIVNDLLKK